MTVSDSMAFYAGLKKVTLDEETDALLERLDLSPYVGRRVGDLSGGLKQRLALALALLSDPPILVLDEPTANLDIRARDDFLALLLSLKEEGKTLIFSSHRLEEVTAIADRVLLMESGKLVFDAAPYDLGQQLGRHATLHIYLSAEGVVEATRLLSERGLKVYPNGRGIRVLVDAEQKGEAIRVLHEAGVPVVDFTVE
jgi:ABC-type multidrug transport system ATPase subunit